MRWPGHRPRPIRCFLFAWASRSRGWYSKRSVRSTFNGMKTSRVFSFAAWHSGGSSTSTMAAVMPGRLADSWVMLVAGISGGITVISKSGSIRKDHLLNWVKPKIAARGRTYWMCNSKLRPLDHSYRRKSCGDLDEWILPHSYFYLKTNPIKSLLKRTFNFITFLILVIVDYSIFFSLRKSVSISVSRFCLFSWFTVRRNFVF